MRTAIAARDLIARGARAAGILLEMIKFQHTIFALPFALSAMLIAARGLPSAWVLLWIVAAAVCARTAAMSFNRWTDAEIDARNPRTSMRAIPAGLVRRSSSLALAIAASILFVICAAMLNALSLALSPVALVVLLGYSYTKRFTALTHFVLGLALGLAPVGAWVAVRGDISATSVLLCIGVMLWTAGFDIVYSCQDYDVDRREGLFSLPVRIGLRPALRVAAGLHVLAVFAFAAAGAASRMGTAYYAGVGVTAALLLAENIVAHPNDARRINVAFFTINGWVGIVMLAATGIDLMLAAGRPL